MGEKERLNQVTDIIIGAAIDDLTSIHNGQMLSYLKLSGCKVGLLLNFNVKYLKNGIRRLVHDFPDH
jgi:GxxExxY protein